MSADMKKEEVLSDGSSVSDSETEEDPYTSYDSPELRAYNYPGNSFHDVYSQRTTQIVFQYHSGRKIARLRAPRDLYGVSSASFLHLPRWPYECEVLKEKVEHIEWNPPTPELMYRPTALEKEAECVGPSEGKVVYETSEGNKGPYFMYSQVGGHCTPLKQTHSRSREKADNTLEFEARFESGNLQKVVQVGEYDYHLTLRTDLYTDRHTQWFYFRVRNTRAGVHYRFTIVNLRKPSSLYSRGMRPLVYSEAEAKKLGVGWHRTGENIKYYRNNLSQNGQPFFSLSWTFRFPHNMDTCYFAHCYPYTYSNLQDYLASITRDPERSKYCKIRVLCRSLAGNMVYVLTITNPSPATDRPMKKKAVIVTARVHPGETNSSWVMKGFLDYILSSSNDAQVLRDSFVFKVVPMLNLDGVIVGNYRCSLTGRDLNRNYKSRLKDSFPSIWFTRNMIRRVMQEREILLYCDLHGHSRKQNVFMYGCKKASKEFPDKQLYLYERIFPLMLSKNDPEKFSFSSCKFKVQKSKEGTGRVVMWKMGIQNSYTLEATYCGSTLGGRCGTHFSTKDLESVGYHFCDTLLDNCDPDQSKHFVFLKELEEMMRLQIKARSGQLHPQSLLDDILTDLDSSTDGSDSSDSNAPPAHLMEMALKMKPMKKLLKTKKERNLQRSRQLNLKQEKQDAKRETRRAERRISEIAMRLAELQTATELQKTPAKIRTSAPKIPREDFFQIPDNKKLSVVYLVFSPDGQVISTKSHACLRDEGIKDISNTMSGNDPAPDSIYSREKQSRISSLWIGDMAPDLDRTTTFLLYDPVSCDLVLPQKANGLAFSAPEKPMETFKVPDFPSSPGHQGVDSLLSAKEKLVCSSAPPSSMERGGRGSHVGAMEALSLPLIPTNRGTVFSGICEPNLLQPKANAEQRQKRTILPKMMFRSDTLKSSSSPALPAPCQPKGGAKRVPVQRGTLGNVLCPSTNCQEAVKENQRGGAVRSTWKNILIGLESGDAAGPLYSQQ
ncbi:cytosolic carboxypeptidase 2 isoform X2 [Xenopus laevis]|uniref:Cytosolic carboxypeptidase 2 isoform X2 n=1 Tax=Xenopus laevis TaxID=8355 RepID=A0A8J1MQ06_XENLA|nr:cytosolic carboxypeptidase 2 isoform X2 [Xenopus laevis]